MILFGEIHTREVGDPKARGRETVALDDRDQPQVAHVLEVLAGEAVALKEEVNPLVAGALKVRRSETVVLYGGIHFSDADIPGGSG